MVAGDPDALFGREESAIRAEYQIGGRIADLRANICNRSRYREIAGEMYMCIEWSIYSNRTRVVVGKMASRGYARWPEPKGSGLAALFSDAFADAAADLATSDRFRMAVGELDDSEGLAGEVREALILPRQDELLQPLRSSLDQLLHGIVTIRSGSAHGSGFIVGPRGEIVTNAHVVGSAPRVLVVFKGGLEIYGQVTRINRGRDVALVKVPMQTRYPLPIREGPLEELDRVFAVGTPIAEEFSATVTEGIVSAIRSFGEPSYPFIQSDAAISPGSSGGPLLDERGNVVGISVARITPPQADGIGLFIPIGDGLASINLWVGEEGASGSRFDTEKVSESPAILKPATDEDPRVSCAVNATIPPEVAVARYRRFLVGCLEKKLSVGNSKNSARRICERRGKKMFPDIDVAWPAGW